MRIKKIEDIFLILGIFLILLSIGTTGCLMGNIPNQSQTNTPTFNAEPSIPSTQSGVRIFKDADSVCIGQTLTFGIINEGNSIIRFDVGDPYFIQINNNGIWGNIFNGGNFQGGWDLPPGKKVKKVWNFSTGYMMNEWYNQSDPTREFIVRPGSYCITFFGTNEITKEPFTISTEFTIQKCQ